MAAAPSKQRPGPLEQILARAPMPGDHKCLEVRYEGLLEYEGHYRRPGDTRQYVSTRHYVSNGRGAIRLDWTTRLESDTTASEPETFLVLGDSVFHRDSPIAPWETFSGPKAELVRLQVWSGLPWEALRAPGAVSLVRPRQGPAGRLDLRAAIRGRERSVSIDSVRARVVAIEDTRAEPRLGDIVDRVEYEYGATAFPEAIAISLHESGAQWTLNERRVTSRTDADGESLLVRPSTFRAAEPEDVMTGKPELVSLAPGVWAADMVDLNTRSLVVEFADHLAVIECAAWSANGERLVDALKAKWPNKPIRYALFSHYHPHYTGGLRALIAEGAKVITTAGNEAFVRAVAELSFRLEPDRLARSPKPVEVITFKGRHELGDATQRIVAVDIGTRSDHTDEFAVFWLPQHKLVFEAEQGWVTVNDTLRASRRAERFLKTLDEEKIEVEQLVQSWPMRGTARDVTRKQLEGLIAQRKK